jgi:osmoprotectant transport system permease protein
VDPGIEHAGAGHVNGFLDGIQWIVNPAHWSGVDGVPSRLWEHVQLSVIALILASLIAIPLGLLVGHTRRGTFLTAQFANLGRAVPSFAVLSVTYLVVIKISPKLAFGSVPTIAALILLAFPVILINTLVGIQQVDADTIEAARGMGMNGRQVLMQLEVPMATPLIMTGLRLAAVLIVATAGLAALVAGGGLGRYVVDGFALQETDRVVAGAILIAILAIATDVLFSFLAKLASPRLRSTDGRKQPPRLISVPTKQV